MKIIYNNYVYKKIWVLKSGQYKSEICENHKIKLLKRKLQFVCNKLNLFEKKLFDYDT